MIAGTTRRTNGFNVGESSVQAVEGAATRSARVYAVVQDLVCVHAAPSTMTAVPMPEMAQPLAKRQAQPQPT